MRARLPEFAPLFPAKEINLHSTAMLPRDYEAGHAIGRAYDSNVLPGDNELSADLHNCLSAYTALTFRGGLEPSLESLGEQGEETPVLGDLREMRRYRLHRTIERNHKLAGMAKAVLGSRCQACGFDFQEFYGEVGAGFIEAHHLRPLSTLEENVSVAVDPATDFAVLCSNCHRMIHRQGAPDDLVGLRALIARH
jgi:5-methylcytosine-specific restriction protein A